MYTGKRVTEIDFEPEILVDSMELSGENGQAFNLIPDLLSNYNR